MIADHLLEAVRQFAPTRPHFTQSHMIHSHRQSLSLGEWNALSRGHRDGCVKTLPRTTMHKQSSDIVEKPRGEGLIWRDVINMRRNPRGHCGATDGVFPKVTQSDRPMIEIGTLLFSGNGW